MCVSIRFTTLCTGARIVNILPSTVSLAESCSSCSPVFHEQQPMCGTFSGKDWGGDRRDLLQVFDHGPIANVLGVENVIDASEMSSDGSLLIHGVATVRFG